MSLPLLAPVSGLETRLGLAVASLAGLDLARAEAALGDTSALIRQVAGRDWVDPTDPTAVVTPDAVVAVVYQVAKRSYSNPDNYDGESVEGYAWKAGPNSTGAYLSNEEKETVRKAANGAAYDTRTPSAYFDPTAFGTADPGIYFWGLE